MPAIITHHLFGEKSATLLPEGMVSTEEELLAFLLGNQGPDPFFFRVLGTPSVVKNAQALGHKMHDEQIYKAFETLRESVSHLPRRDAEVGRAFALGMLSHYALDRAAHPFVYGDEFAIIDADPSLKDSDSQVHAVIESDIDTWMLWQMRHSSVDKCSPASELVWTDRILQVAGALMSQVAWAVFGLAVSPTGYGSAVKQMQLTYKVIEPAGSLGSKGIGDIEKLAVHEHSLIESLAHCVVTSDSCPAANNEHHTWKDPWTGEARTDSFMDCFNAALDGWPELAHAFTVGGAELKSALGGKNYSGKLSAEIVTKELKLAKLQEWAAELGISQADTIAIGDGANDIPMILAAGTGIAFCAKPKVQEVAPHAINERNLMRVFDFIDETQPL